MRHLARDCPNRGTRDDFGINLKRAFGSSVGMTRDKDVSSLVLTTTPQQELEQYSDFTMSHVPVAICCLFWSLWNNSFFIGVIGLRCQVQNTVGTQTEPESIPPPSPPQQHTPRTVLITENGMKSTKVFQSSTVCSTLNRSMKVTSFRQCTQLSITFSGNLCRVGSFCGGRRQRLCVAGHGSIQISWRLHDGAICD